MAAEQPCHVPENCRPTIIHLNITTLCPLFGGAKQRTFIVHYFLFIIIVAMRADERRKELRVIHIEENGLTTFVFQLEEVNASLHIL